MARSRRKQPHRRHQTAVVDDAVSTAFAVVRSALAVPHNVDIKDAPTSRPINLLPADRLSQSPARRTTKRYRVALHIRAYAWMPRADEVSPFYVHDADWYHARQQAWTRLATNGTMVDLDNIIVREEPYEQPASGGQPSPGKLHGEPAQHAHVLAAG